MKTFWFVVGSQLLYGEETLKKVEENAKHIIETMKTKHPIIYKGIVKTWEDANDIVRHANFDEDCLGIISFCHTFSPSKMWVNALQNLQKPWMHLHTQLNVDIPNEAINMDYMNLHQSAHGDREHGFIGARLDQARKIVVGHYKNKATWEQISLWQDVVMAVSVSRDLKVIRFGDNMREVAVTEGDKLEAQKKLGWQVNTIGVGHLVEEINKITDLEVATKLEEYQTKYTFHTKNIPAIKYQAKAEIAISKILREMKAGAFTNTFEDLYGMEQLPGLATQNLMAAGYGYGGEGDWKVAAMTRIFKAINKTASFMEDYTYDWKNGYVLGSHMLEVCPTIATDLPRIEVHPLGIGGKADPARLVFTGKTGFAKTIALIDLGHRFRLIVQDVECILPTQTMPNLPVARVMWRPEPNLETSALCWLTAGGSHHTTLVYDLPIDFMRDFADILNIELVHIHKDTDINKLKDTLKLNEIYYQLRR